MCHCDALPMTWQLPYLRHCSVQAEEDDIKGFNLGSSGRGYNDTNTQSCWYSVCTARNTLLKVSEQPVLTAQYIIKSQGEKA